LYEFAKVDTHISLTDVYLAFYLTVEQYLSIAVMRYTAYR